LAALEERIEGRIGDVVYLVEHPHVFTHGRGDTAPMPSFSEVTGERVEHVAVERGGEVTYHGPGQLVAYPIIDVRAMTGDLHRFLGWLEDVLIATIAEFGIAGRHHPNYTGAWVEERKIASIGVAVRKWVSYHGVALNVNTDLRFFSDINPCGLVPETMTSMAALRGSPVPMSEVKRALARCLEQTAVDSILRR
jgi:lipoate-protein ligase B